MQMHNMRNSSLAAKIQVHAKVNAPSLKMIISLNCPSSLGTLGTLIIAWTPHLPFQTPIDSEPELSMDMSQIETAHEEEESMEIKYQNARFNSYGNWPFPDMEVDPQLAFIYDRVRAAGAPNYKGARVPLSSPLCPDAWMTPCTGHPHDSWIVDGVRFGFPIQYTGGPCYDPQADYNHPSAAAYHAHVMEYFEKETQCEAMAGPYKPPPSPPGIGLAP